MCVRVRVCVCALRRGSNSLSIHSLTLVLGFLSCVFPKQCGEFIGGSDIMIEMYQNGELGEMIEKASSINTHTHTRTHTEWMRTY